MSEFGRTPTINRNYGRDHWSRAWSVALAGCGIKGGAVVGKTNANGTAVTDRQVNGGHLFHTYFRALGLDPKKNYYVDQRPIPMADPKADADQGGAGMNFAVPRCRPPAKIDPTQTRMVQELKHTSPLLGCRFDPTGRFVFAGAQDNTRPALGPGHRQEDGAGSATRAGCAPWRSRPKEQAALHRRLRRQAARLAAGRRGAGAAAHRRRPPAAGCVPLAVSPDGKTLASLRQRPPRQALVDRRRQAGPRAWRATTCHVYNVAFHPDGKHLVSADLQGRRQGTGTSRPAAEVRDAGREGAAQVRPDLPGRHRRRAQHGVQRRDGTLLACAGITDVQQRLRRHRQAAGGAVRLADRQAEAAAAAQGRLPGHGVGRGLPSERFPGGGRRRQRRGVWFWKPDQPQSFFALKLPNNARDLDLHPDGKRLAVAFADGAVRIFDMTPKPA